MNKQKINMANKQQREVEERFADIKNLAQKEKQKGAGLQAEADTKRALRDELDAKRQAINKVNNRLMNCLNPYKYKHTDPNDYPLIQIPTKIKNYRNSPKKSNGGASLYSK